MVCLVWICVGLFGQLVVSYPPVPICRKSWPVNLAKLNSFLTRTLTFSATAVALEVENTNTLYATLFAVTELTDWIWNALPSVDANWRESPASGVVENVVTSILPDWLTVAVPDVRVAVAPDVPPVTVSLDWNVPDSLTI